MAYGQSRARLMRHPNCESTRCAGSARPTCYCCLWGKTKKSGRPRRGPSAAMSP